MRSKTDPPPKPWEMNVERENIDFDLSVELALATVAKAEQHCDRADALTSNSAHIPAELLDAAGWPCGQSSPLAQD